MAFTSGGLSWQDELFDGAEDDFEVGAVAVGRVGRVLAATEHGRGVLLRGEAQRGQVGGKFVVGAVTERLGLKEK